MAVDDGWLEGAAGVGPDGALVVDDRAVAAGSGSALGASEDTVVASFEGVAAAVTAGTGVGAGVESAIAADPSAATNVTEPTTAQKVLWRVLILCIYPPIDGSSTTARITIAAFFGFTPNEDPPKFMTGRIGELRQVSRHLSLRILVINDQDPPENCPEKMPLRSVGSVRVLSLFVAVLCTFAALSRGA